MRNDHVHHLLILGDQKLGIRWVPWAKSKLKDLQRYHPGFDGKSFGKKKYQHTIGTDGFVVIEIKMVKEQKWVLIWTSLTPGLYMESGILDHRSIAPLNENTYLPSILHYNTNIDAIRSPGAALGKMEVDEIEPLKLDGENRGVGDSKALGCPKSEKEREISISIPTIFATKDNITFKSEIPKYCADLLLYKYYQDRFPPSMFSGKLRLLVQAIFGTKRRDYSTDLSLPASTATLNFPNGGFSPWDTGNTGLFSGRKFEYFRIRVARNGIWALQLTPSKAGKELRKYLLDNPDIPDDRKLRYETYLLSTLYFTKEAKNNETKIGEIGEFFDFGTPFGYGVSWNWKGDTGYKAVTQKKPGTSNVWQASLLRVTVAERDLAETVEEGRLVAVTVKEEGPTDYTFRVNQDLIWEPDWLQGGMQLFVTQEDAFDVPDHVDADVPIKVVTNYANDSHDVVRFKREDRGSGSGSFGGTAFNESAINELGIGCGTYSCEVNSDSNGTIEVGFYIKSVTGVENADWQAVNKDGDGVEVASGEAGFTGGPFEVTCPGTPNLADLCDPPDVTVDGDNDAHYPAFGGRAILRGDFNFQEMLVVPYFDCDAVYLGSEWDFAGRIDSQHTLPGASVWGGRYLYNNGVQIEGNPYRHPWDWDTDSDPGGGDGEFCTSSSRFLFRSSKAQDKWVGGNKSSDQIFAEVAIKIYANGEFIDVHVDRGTDSLEVSEWLFLPSCLNVFNTPLLQAPTWEHKTVGHGGFEFNPVVFPEAENALAVLAKNSANFHSFRATKNPGGGDQTIDDGSYDMDSISTSGDNFLFSFVGFS